MRNGLRYLRPNVVVEPLIDRWYAWSHLISPATAAMNLVGRHLRIMESYVANPKVHAAAVSNPALRGGPFVDYQENRVDEIRDLMAKTIRERGQAIAFAQAIHALDDLLRREATGYSLEPLYPRVPDALKGYVELGYDLNLAPSFRVIESLLYRSSLYDRAGQSLMLSLISQDDRPFVMSTPRLEGPDSVHASVPFDNPSVDALFRAATTPAHVGALADELCVPDDRRARFAELFTESPPPSYERYTGPGLRWRYFGHACILIETAETAVLLDPVLSYTYESDISRYTYQDLPDHIDYVMITHNHQDHLLLETVLQLRHKIGTILVPRNGGGALQDPSLKLTLRQIGFTNVRELDELETLEIPGGAITAVPFFGEHADLHVRTKAAYHVRVGRTSLLFAADSCVLEPALYDHVQRELGDIDVLFLGMECNGAPLTWLYGPLLTQALDTKMDRSRRLAGSDFARAAEVVARLRPREIYVYAMGQEPWLNHVMNIKYTEQSKPIVESNRLIESCRDRDLVAERLYGEKELIRC